MHDLDDERLRKLLEVFGRHSDLEPIAELARIVVVEQRDQPWLAVTHLYFDRPSVAGRPDPPNRASIFYKLRRIASLSWGVIRERERYDPTELRAWRELEKRLRALGSPPDVDWHDLMHR